MIEKLIELEKEKQARSIQLIASENFVSKNILKVQGSILTDKYAEGYPNNRYYGGCEIIDKVELYAQEKALDMYENPRGYSVNVQPHSGSQANQAVYVANLNHGDTVVALSLDHGGHLTHGFRLSTSGMFYNFVHYKTVNGKIDYQELEMLLLKNKPKLLVVGASAYPFIIDFEKIQKIVKSVSPDTKIMADMAHIAGLIVAKKHPSPFGYCDFITSTTHKTLRGPRGGIIFCKDEYIADINRALFPGIQGGPLMHVIGAKAVCFEEACTKEYHDYINQIILNTQAFDKALKENGFVTSGTENHLILINTYESYDIDGYEVQILLEEHDIIVNKNLLPNDPLTAKKPSGVRVGTPAMTTKGYKENDFIKLAEKIKEIIINHKKSL